MGSSHHDRVRRGRLYRSHVERNRPPAGTPPDVVDKLNKAIAQVLSTPEMKQRYAAIGTTVLIGSPDDFAKLIRDETAKWQRTIKASGIKAE